MGLVREWVENREIGHPPNFIVDYLGKFIETAHVMALCIFSLSTDQEKVK